VILRELRAAGWRNLKPVALTPGPRASVFFGQNGQGKTNLLEAAFYLSEFRSFRTKTIGELTQWGAPKTALAAEVETAGLQRRIDIELGPGKKVVRLDGKGVRRDTPALRGLGVVVFVPEDLLLPRSAPSARRSFLDRAAYNVDRLFFGEAVAFQKVLKNRNAALRRGGAFAQPTMLATYDDELARTGARLVQRRRVLTAALAPRVQAFFVALHADREVVIRYRSDPTVEAAQGEPAVADALREGLVRSRPADLRRGFTGFGPQTDDLEITLDGRPVREHGSQGQVRSLVLALKLAELANLTEALGEPPLLLLDDVASELDQLRRHKLFETILTTPGQTFISVTDKDLIPPLPGRVDFQVTGGEIALYSSP
jgi:DNA replication and repair protein RecF